MFDTFFSCNCKTTSGFPAPHPKKQKKQKQKAKQDETQKKWVSK